MPHTNNPQDAQRLGENVDLQIPPRILDNLEKYEPSLLIERQPLLETGHNRGNFFYTKQSYK